MQPQRRRTSVVFFALLLVQVLSPLAFVQAEQTPYQPQTDAALESLQQVGIAPAPTAEHGWMNSDEASGETALLYRDVQLVSPTEWTERTGEKTVDGFHILGHTYPVPSSWFHDLDASGIECFSFLPPASFHCHVNGKTPAQLEQLDVLGLAVMDATDKVQTDLVRGLIGLDMVAPNPFVNEATSSSIPTAVGSPPWPLTQTVWYGLFNKTPLNGLSHVPSMKSSTPKASK